MVMDTRKVPNGPLGLPTQAPCIGNGLTNIPEKQDLRRRAAKPFRLSTLLPVEVVPRTISLSDLGRHTVQR